MVRFNLRLFTTKVGDLCRLLHFMCLISSYIICRCASNKCLLSWKIRDSYLIKSILESFLGMGNSRHPGNFISSPPDPFFPQCDGSAGTSLFPRASSDRTSPPLLPVPSHHHTSLLFHCSCSSKYIFSFPSRSFSLLPFSSFLFLFLVASSRRS